MAIILESQGAKKEDTQMKVENNNELFIFADQSGSMSGAPFESVKMACL